MQILLLGPVTAVLGGIRLRLAGERQRALVGILALEKGKTVTTSRLLGLLWGDSPPLTARTKLQGLVSSFRNTIRSETSQGYGPLPETEREYLLTKPHGYELSADGVGVDAGEFDHLVTQARQARQAGQPHVAAEMLERALGVWQGRAFADVLIPGIRGIAEAMDERRLLALEEKAEVNLSLGQVDLVAAELRIWVNEFPLRERLRALLMQALYDCGCRADALHVYRIGRDATVAELGLEPGPELQRIHHRILSGDAGSRSRART